MNGLDVAPELPMDNPIDDREAHSILRGQITDNRSLVPTCNRVSFWRPIRSAGANYEHVGLGEFRPSMVRTEVPFRHSVLAPFDLAVEGIHSRIAKEEMRRVTAPAVVTDVQDVHPLRDRTIRKGPGDSMGACRPTVEGHRAVASPIHWPEPGPAERWSIRRVQALMQSLKRWCMFVLTAFPTIYSRTSGECRWNQLKVVPAPLTSKRDPLNALHIVMDIV